MQSKAQNTRQPVGWRVFLTQICAKILNFKANIPQVRAALATLFYFNTLNQYSCDDAKQAQDRKEVGEFLIIKPCPYHCEEGGAIGKVGDFGGIACCKGDRPKGIGDGIGEDTTPEKTAQLGKIGQKELPFA